MFGSPNRRAPEQDKATRLGIALSNAQLALPDQRLGQIIQNASDGDAFYATDEELIKAVNSYVARARG